jgi:hypothetical protein
MVLPATAPSFLLAALLAGYAGPARATDVLVLYENSPRGMWRMELVAPQTRDRASAGSIQVESRGKVLTTLHFPGDRFLLSNGTPYLLVFQRNPDGGFVQQFRLEDSRHHFQDFLATTRQGRLVNPEQGFLPNSPYVRVRPIRHADGAVLDPAEQAVLQRTIHHTFDTCYLEITGNAFPAP